MRQHCGREAARQALARQFEHLAQATQARARQGGDGIGRQPTALDRNLRERRQQLAVQRKPLERQIKKIEQLMDQLHGEQKALDAALADPASYEDANKAQLKEWLLQKSEMDRQLAKLEEEWLTLQEAWEAVAPVATRPA